jgi:hypothetical protein
MARKISCIVTNSGTINAVVNNKAHSVAPDHANYARIKQAVIDDNPEEFERQVNVAEAVKSYTAEAKNTEVGEVTVVDGAVVWNGKPVHSVLSNRILKAMQDGFPFDPLCKFLANLMRNPSKRAVDELYTFLEHQGLPITEDGCFLGYKRVQEDYTDCHTGTVNNKIGNVLEMPRNTVDDNWRELCSSGFHVGSIEYVRGFYGDRKDYHVMIVKVNPADVVSVPNYDNTKLRTCKYEVVAEYDAKLITPMPETLHTSTGEAVPAASRGITDAEWDSMKDDDSELDSDLELDEDYDDDEGEDDEKVIQKLVDLARSKVTNIYKLAFDMGVTNDDFDSEMSLERIIKLVYYDFVFTKREIEEFINMQ